MNKPAWDRLYTTRRWRTFRWRILVRDNFTCRMCGRVGPSSEMVADHRQPHKGDMRLFWDPENCQTLCASPCHNSVKQSQEKGGNKPMKRAISLDGWPAED
jgi:5-methylcytosine-specific restriction protein A